MSKNPEKQPKKPKQPRRKLHTQTYRYRIYPTQKQLRILGEWLGSCCEVYNAVLDERKSAYRMAGISLSYTHQCAELPGCKEVRPDLCEVPTQVLQDAVKRVDRAYDDFYRRVREGQTPGYPRFRSRSRYDSLTFKQYENSFRVLPAKKHKATCPKVGACQDGDASAQQRDAEDSHCQTHPDGKMVCEYR
jgi:transposase